MTQTKIRNEQQALFALKDVISPSILTGDVNNWNPTGLSTASVIKVTVDATPRTITGLAGGTDGRVIIIENLGETLLTLAGGSTSSSEANRFQFTDDKKLEPDDSIILWYDIVISRWKSISETYQGTTASRVIYSPTGQMTATNVQDALDELEEFKIRTDGWDKISYTWTRTGNHTFSISGGDVTAIYRKGTKIRYKDGGAYEYGIIASSSFAASTTTVNLIPNTDYAMAATTITDRYISHIENPEGFPGSFNYTANVVSGAGSITSYTVNSAKWTPKSPNVIIISADITINNNGTGNGTVNVDVPVTITVATISSGRERGILGKQLQVVCDPAQTVAKLLNYDNTYPAAASYILEFSAIVIF